MSLVSTCSCHLTGPSIVKYQSHATCGHCQPFLPQRQILKKLLGHEDQLQPGSLGPLEPLSAATFHCSVASS